MVDRASSAGLLVVRRINLFSEENPGGPVPDRRPALPLSHGEITERYRGFDGYVWPEDGLLAQIRQVDLNDYGLGFGGVAPLEQLARVMEYYESVSRRWLCDLLFLDFVARPASVVTIPQGFSFCGFDYGLYASPGQVYSVVCNEIIYALDVELAKFAAELTHDCLLLPDLETVDRLVTVRRQMITSGIDLETDDDMYPHEPIAIYTYPRCSFS